MPAGLAAGGVVNSIRRAEHMGYSRILGALRAGLPEVHRTINVKGRVPFSYLLEAYDIVEGPVARQTVPRSRNWVPNPRFVIWQEAFKSGRAWGSLLRVEILPAE